jgi:hypothetical protein
VKFVRVDLEHIKDVSVCDERIKIFMNNDAVYDIKTGKERMEELLCRTLSAQKITDQSQ